MALQPHGPRPPFFWVHGERSNEFLARHLGPEQPLYAVLHQSHDGQRARFTRMEDIAAYYLEGVSRIQSRGPFYLGGYCVGGTLAFEMAQQLRRRGEEVALLVLLDPPVTGPGASPLGHIATGSSSGPDRTPPEAPGPPAGHRVHRHLRHLARLGPREQLAYVRQRVVRKSSKWLSFAADTAKRVWCIRRGVTGDGNIIRPSQRSRYINAVHFRAKRGYVPEVYGGRVVVLKTDGGCRDPETVWGSLAGGGLEILDVPGRHTEIVVDERQIENLAKLLKACLETAGPSYAARHWPKGSEVPPVRTIVNAIEGARGKA
ncbi:MAG TPA: thioesterase domain-containing protein [Vicinamibacterales bacterium]|nr:thioesterase domain-containing protein [Vicinamibacterales bacterium]